MSLLLPVDFLHNRSYVNNGAHLLDHPQISLSLSLIFSDSPSLCRPLSLSAYIFFIAAAEGTLAGFVFSLN